MNIKCAGASSLHRPQKHSGVREETLGRSICNPHYFLPALPYVIKNFVAYINICFCPTFTQNSFPWVQQYLAFLKFQSYFNSAQPSVYSVTDWQSFTHTFRHIGWIMEYSVSQTWFSPGLGLVGSWFRTGLVLVLSSFSPGIGLV